MSALFDAVDALTSMDIALIAARHLDLGIAIAAYRAAFDTEGQKG